MRWKDYIKSVFLNLKGRKKIGKSVTILVFLSLSIYFVINSMADSIDYAVNYISNIPAARTLMVEDDENYSVYREFKKKIEGDSRIQDVYHYIPELSVDMHGVNQNNSLTIALKSYSKSLESYLYKGTEPNKGEILLPEYMYGYDKKGYLAGSDLIGRNVSFRIKDYNGKETTFEYKVSGTYNNIYAVTGNNMAMLPDTEAVKVLETEAVGKDKKLAEKMKETGDYDASHYIGYEVSYFCGVCVNDIDVIKELQQEYPQYLLHQEMDTSQNIIKSMFGFIRFWGNIVILLLIVIALIDRVIVSARDIQGRGKEMAIYLAQGYTQKQVKKLFLLEYLIRIGKGMLAALISSIVILQVGNYIIRYKMPMEYSIIELQFSMRYLFLGFLMFLTVVLSGGYQVTERIKKIKVSRVLKEEG